MADPIPAREPPEYVTAQLRDALARDQRVAELDVHVAVAGGRIYITGHSATVDRKEAITAVARELLPGHEVCNEVTVAEFPEAEGEEELS